MHEEGSGHRGLQCPRLRVPRPATEASVARAVSHIMWLDKSLQACRPDSTAAMVCVPGEAWQKRHGFQECWETQQILKSEPSKLWRGHRKILSLP